MAGYRSVDHETGRAASCGDDRRISGVAIVLHSPLWLVDEQVFQPRETMKRPFLTLYDYETGGVWAYIYAESPEEIHSKFRDLTVYESPPKWMSDTERQDIESRSSFDLETVETQHPTFAGLLRKATGSMERQHRAR